MTDERIEFFWIQRQWPKQMEEENGEEE